MKGVFEVHYSPKKSHLDLTGTHEQTNKLFRTRLYATFKSKYGRVKVDSRGEIEWRQRYRGGSQAGDSYLDGIAQGKIRYAFSKTVGIWGDLKGEFVNFAAQTSFARNYLRFGEKIGTSLACGTSNIDLDLFWQQRSVADSLEMGYSTFGGDATLFGLYDWGDIDILAHAERRRYNRTDSVGDYSRFETNARGRVRFGDRWYLRPELFLEQNRYVRNDVVSQDYWRLQGALLAGYGSLGAASILLGPAADILSQRHDTIALPQDYQEWAARVEFDYVRPAAAFWTIQGDWGHRKLQTEDSSQSSFRFLRTNIMGDLSITKRINFNCLLGAEWEWHTSKVNNTRLVLLSSSLMYSF